jgi:hypothetical protein
MKKYNIQTRRRGKSYIPLKKRKANWIGNILRRKCILKHVIEERIELPERRGRRRNWKLDVLQKMTGY